jgi:hypothetical protein
LETWEILSTVEGAFEPVDKITPKVFLYANVNSKRYLSKFAEF